MANPNGNVNGGNDPFIPVRHVTTSTTLGGAPAADALYPPEGPDPKGVTPGATQQMERGADSSAAGGAGIEGEDVMWEARYSMRNFLGRVTFRVLLTFAWVVMAVETWGNSHEDLAPVTIALGVALGVFWLALLYRIAQAYYGHYYRLTNRRLFVSTGLMRRRRDQMELLRVKDVFTRQTLVERWLSLGTVVVVSTEKELPVFYLAGVNDPKQVMDLVWHHARAERDNRSTKIDSV